ncbi:MAG: NAD(P)-dependent oxidoreductase [Oceanospirillaceae bacterium]
MKNILITGANGNLGRVLRLKLKDWSEQLTLSDITDVENLASGEANAQCDLADFAAVNELVQGCDGIIHLGGVSTENTFENILNSNIIGTYNLYEASRKQGIKRILFASSNHAIGFHERETLLDANSPIRADSLYGVSKGYGEILARLYYDKYQIETAIVRIGSCFEQPKDRRMLATWLSADDFALLIKRIFETDRLGCPVIYGASANKELWWDNSLVDYLGWKPVDSSDDFADLPHLQTKAVDANDPAIRYQGGGFAAAGHFED